MMLREIRLSKGVALYAKLVSCGFQQAGNTSRKDILQSRSWYRHTWKPSAIVDIQLALVHRSSLSDGTFSMFTPRSKLLNDVSLAHQRYQCLASFAKVFGHILFRFRSKLERNNEQCQRRCNADRFVKEISNFSLLYLQSMFFKAKAALWLLTLEGWIKM